MSYPLKHFIQGLNLALVTLLLPLSAYCKTIDIHPGQGTDEINRVLNAAVAGDTLFFHKGIYRGPFEISGVRGSSKLPVVIRGERQTGNDPEKGTDQDFLTLIDGATEPGINKQHWAFLLRDCSWISIEDMHIRNCWTDLVRAENSSWISLRNSRLYGGKRALFAVGRGSHHFLVEGCSWEQDRRVWTHEEDYSWDEIHHGIHKHYNGSLFQGSGISGVFVLRDNTIRNTFNAFRLSQINDGESDPLACTNGEIYRNTIINTSDNVLEPEVHALNLHFYHNRMINGHAFVSITEVSGGDIYIYGNTAVSLPESEDGWTVFKISSNTRALTRPLYIFNNSWHVDFDMIGSPRNLWKNDHLRHFNNACFSEVQDTFGIYWLGKDNRFDYDCSNVPFPLLLTSRGFEKHGVVADPLFRAPFDNDFRLRPDSPCIDRGKKAEGLILTYEGRRPDMGAWEGESPVEGLAFRYMDPGVKVPYVDLPRITRVKVEKKQVRIWFSQPMDAFSLKAVRKALELGGERYPLEYKKLTGEGYCLVLSGRTLPHGPDLVPAAGAKLVLSAWPIDLRGKALTAWASELAVSVSQDL